MSNPMSICVWLGEQSDINSNAPRPQNLDHGETANQRPGMGQDGPIREEKTVLASSSDMTCMIVPRLRYSAFNWSNLFIKDDAH